MSAGKAGDQRGSHLLVLAGKGALVVPLPASGAVTIGRGAECEVSIPHPSVSRKHGILHMGPAGAVYEDLKSRNGTSVNNKKLGPGERRGVAPGDEIKVGDALLLLRHGLDDGTDRGIDTTGIDTSPSQRSAAQPVIVSDAMRRLYESVDRVATGSISVLLLGETGVGKEVVARAIHARSPRAKKPFLGLSCASFPETLLEAELFGHEKGAFSGAQAAKPGLLESAQGGTVFLDEIAEVPLSMQSKLLRVIEERSVLRLGALEARPIDVRFVAATNRALDEDAESGRFRKDLYFRLGGVTLRIPPLRERADEIVPLARHFLEALGSDLGRATPPELSEDALARLAAHSWPGNVRELRNVVERALLLSKEGPIEARHLDLSTTPSPAVSPAAPTAVTLREGVASSERDQIVAALESCNGNQTRAAKLLGIARSTLIVKLDRYGIPRPQKRS